MAGYLEVLNPVADLYSESTQFSAARRPPSLEGKRVGLYWNYKPGGNIALETVQRALEARYDNIQVKMYPAPRPVPKNVLEAVQKECDAVIGSTAD